MSQVPEPRSDLVVRPGHRVGVIYGWTLWPVTVLEYMGTSSTSGERRWLVLRDPEPLEYVKETTFVTPESRMMPLPDPALRGGAAAVSLHPPARRRRARRRPAAPA